MGSFNFDATREIRGGDWKFMSCRRCGYDMIMDICGCILPLCNPPSREHDWECIAETWDRDIAFAWIKKLKK